MIVSRDYGAIYGKAYPNNNFEYVKRGQVWQVTHDGGGNSLPYRYRSFISFSYGGKWIEDFDLIAYCNGNTMSRDGSAPFEDLVTEYDIMDGQYYHGTHYKPNTLSLDLVTDGIDQQKLEEFLHWFVGGKSRELILAEHPNRAIMARIAEAPQLNVTPFEKKITMQVAGIEYQTSTTVYRGTISLKLVSDLPFWYAKQNVLVLNQVNQGLLKGSNGNQLLTTETDLFKEALKVVYEDTVPLNSMVQSTMHFGGDYYASVDANLAYMLIAGPVNPNDPTTMPSDWNPDIPGYFTYEVNNEIQYWRGARTEGASESVALGRIAGAVMATEDTSLTGPIAANSSKYQLFYGGTAPSPTILSFKINLTPVGSSDYVNCIASSQAKNNSKEYSTIRLISEHQKNFDFTTPNVITSYNKVIKLFKNISTNSIGTNWKDLQETIRDQIRHPAVRAYAIAIINKIQGDTTYFTDNGIFKEDGKTFCKNIMKKFFQPYIQGNDWSESYSDASFVFNAETGEAKGTFSYWKAITDSENIINFISNIDTSTSADDIEDHFKEHTEDVGDMLRSNWLFIEDHNQLVDNQYVSAWTSASPRNAHKVVPINVRTALQDLKVEYKNMYL